MRALFKIAALPGTRVLAVSSLYETPPWGVTDQPDFTNAVAAIGTPLPPLELLDLLKRIESSLGRKQRERWGPREIDLDILTYRKMKLDLNRLTLPHKHMLERDFVMVPLLEITPEMAGGFHKKGETAKCLAFFVKVSKVISKGSSHLLRRSGLPYKCGHGRY